MKKLFLFAALIISLSLVGCGPRGETRTLDEVLASARAEFSHTREKASLPSDIAPHVEAIAKNLEVLAGDSTGAAVTGSAKQIEEAIGAVILRAGYTSRPTLTELRRQYMTLSGAAAGDEKIPNPSGARRLLAARTYHAFAAELQTTAFGVGGEKKTEPAQAG